MKRLVIFAGIVAVMFALVDFNTVGYTEIRKVQVLQQEDTINENVVENAEADGIETTEEVKEEK